MPPLPKPDPEIQKAINELHSLLNDESFWTPKKNVKPVPDIITFSAADIAFLASVGMKP